MQSVLDRAAAHLARHPAPALTLAELARLLSDDAPRVAMRPDLLLRALRQCPERFRVIDAGSGRRRVLSLLARLDRDGNRVTKEPSVPGRNGERGPRGAPGRSDEHVKRHASGELADLTRGPWIIGVETDARAPATPGLRVLRASLGFLGQRIDEESGCDVARWVGLVVECRKVGERARSAEPRPAA